MPSAKKSKSNPIVDHFPPDLEPSPPELTAEPDIRGKKKKDRNAGGRLPNIQNDPSESLPDQELIPEEPSSPPPPAHSVLSQLPHGFPSARKSKPLDIRDDQIPTEKVSDLYSPSIEPHSHDDVTGKSPSSDLLLGTNFGNTPPAEPGFSTRTNFNTKTPPVSPPQRNARPVSFGGSIPPLPHHARRPISAYGSPPAPHLPQQHFYGAHDIDLGLPPSGIRTQIEAPKFVKFTKLPDFTISQRQGILVGFEGRLNIIAYSGTNVEEIGCLAGLPGTIIDATLLTWTSGADPMKDLRPLVAITLHGLDYNPDSDANDETHPLYSTKVLVYSVPKRQHIAELLRTPSIQSQMLMHGMPPAAPSPVGNLRTHASGNYCSVASGISGEVFVFGLTKMGTYPTFECISKVWTSLQPHANRRDSSHHRASDADVSPADFSRGDNTGNEPILAMNGRWLAICPASNSSRTAIGMSLGTEIVNGRHSGSTITSAPSRPSVNCEVDSPDVDTLLSKVARGVAQEMVKGAKWLGDQGIQAWQSYWKKDEPTTSPPIRPVYSPHTYPTLPGYGPFPPTHADPIQESKDPELVSIFDLNSLHDQSNKKTPTPTPFATFQPPRGCSYLSFSPNGLNLLTSSRKGDLQYVWDLLQIRFPRHTITVGTQENHRSQCRVRQIARYERLSGSTIVDVVWESPSATRFAILTKNKTIHLFDLPANAFRWPPPRTSSLNRPTSAPIDRSLTTDHDSPPATGFFASAMNIAGKTQPMLANWRGRAPSVGGGFAGIGSTGIGLASATGAKGSKAVAAGLSKSLGAATETVSRIQHAGESRLHLRSTNDPQRGRISWATRAQKAGLSILDDQSVKFYQVRRSLPRDHRQRDGPSVFDARKGLTTKFPSFSHLEDEGTEIDGFWSTKPTVATQRRNTAHPLSFAEIETNAPYQPFHSDRRVNLLIYTDTTMDTGYLPTTSILSSSEPEHNRKSEKRDDLWVFGSDIPATRLNLNISHFPEDERGNDEGSVIYRETTVTNNSADDNVEQIVSTTRRRKAKKATRQNSATPDLGEDDLVSPQEGFFEDDCDVLDFATDRV